MTTALDDTRVAPLAGADGLPQSLAPLQALVSSSAADHGDGEPAWINGDGLAGAAALDSLVTA